MLANAKMYCCDGFHAKFVLVMSKMSCCDGFMPDQKCNVVMVCKPRITPPKSNLYCCGETSKMNEQKLGYVSQLRNRTKHRRFLFFCRGLCLCLSRSLFLPVCLSLSLALSLSLSLSLSHPLCRSLFIPFSLALLKPATMQPAPLSRQNRWRTTMLRRR